MITLGFRPDLLSGQAGLRSALNHIRWIAALAVAAAHIRNLTMPDYVLVSNPSAIERGWYFLTLLADQAVVIFFVVSGLLVGGPLVRRFGSGAFYLGAYARDRAARLYVVLIPALVLTAVLGAGAQCSTHAEYGLDFLSSLTFLQNALGQPPCNNHPLWSLSNEAFYYVAAPLVGLAVMGPRRGLALVLLVGLTALAIPSLRQGPHSIPFGALLWVCGLVPWVVRLRCSPWATLPVLLAVLGAARLRLFPGAYAADLAVAFSAALFFSCDFAGWVARPTATRVGTALAAFSYSLYLVHMPIAQAMVDQLHTLNLTAPTPHVRPISILAFAGILTTALAAAWLFGRVFEANTPRVRAWLGKTLTGAAPSCIVP